MNLPFPLDIDKIRAANILETLQNLNYLTLVDAADPGKVRLYAHIREERLQALRELLRLLQWPARIQESALLHPEVRPLIPSAVLSTSLRPLL